MLINNAIKRATSKKPTRAREERTRKAKKTSCIYRRQQSNSSKIFYSRGIFLIVKVWLDLRKKLKFA
jgi:hypothetical protein